jgi:hypothetical protein
MPSADEHIKRDHEMSESLTTPVKIQPQWRLIYTTVTEPILKLRMLLIHLRSHHSNVELDMLCVRLWLSVDHPHQSQSLVVHFSDSDINDSDRVAQAQMSILLNEQGWVTFHLQPDETLYRLVSVRQLIPLHTPVLLPPFSTSRLDVIFRIDLSNLSSQKLLHRALKIAQKNEVQPTSAYTLDHLQANASSEQAQWYPLLFCSVDHYFITWLKAQSTVIIIDHISHPISLSSTILNEDQGLAIKPIWFHLGKQRHQSKTPHSRSMVLTNEKLRINTEFKWCPYEHRRQVPPLDVDAILVPTSSLKELRYEISELSQSSLSLLSIAQIQSAHQVVLLIHISRGLSRDTHLHKQVLHILLSIPRAEPLRRINSQPLCYLSLSATLSPPVHDRNLLHLLLNQQKERALPPAQLLLISFERDRQRPSLTMSVSRFGTIKFYRSELFKLILWPNRAQNLSEWRNSAYLRLKPQSVQRERK